MLVGFSSKQLLLVGGGDEYVHLKDAHPTDKSLTAFATSSTKASKPRRSSTKEIRSSGSFSW